MSAAVGGLPNASDPDVNNLVFSITSGNSAGVFAISGCLGQLRVARAVLDYMTGPRQYNLTVTVTDDGYPPMNASANFTINLVCWSMKWVCLVGAHLWGWKVHTVQGDASGACREAGARWLQADVAEVEVQQC